ncbi:10165_t:CDS:2, partial [Diversispora eburnea]
MKNLTLTLFIIAIYSNFALARESLKWGGVKLFDAFQSEKKYARIFSNRSSSSNVERATCPPGYPYECPGTDYCCETVCGEVCEYGCCNPGNSCCKRGCCLPGYLCLEDGYCCPPGYNSCGNGYCYEKDKICEPEEPEEPEIPEPSISCGLTADEIKSSNYRDTAKKADPNTFAYEYEPNSGMIIQKTLKDIEDNLSYYDADHVFEAQIITNWLGHLPEEYRDKMCCSIKLNLNELKDIVNDETNLRFLSKEINNAKGQLFAGNKISDPKREFAVSYYLAIDDVYNAFVMTRNKVIDFLVKAVEEVTDNVCDGFTVARRSVTILLRRAINVTYIKTDFSDFSRSAYENLTYRTLSDDKTNNNSSNDSSSIFQLPYLSIKLFMTL